MSNTSEAQITSASVLAFTIPTDQPESDGTAKWDATTVVIVEITAGGRTGLGYAYANIAAAQVAKELIEKCLRGENAFDIPRLHSKLDRAVRNWGRPALISSGISVIDTCL